MKIENEMGQILTKRQSEYLLAKYTENKTLPARMLENLRHSIDAMPKDKTPTKYRPKRLDAMKDNQILENCCYYVSIGKLLFVATVQSKIVVRNKIGTVTKYSISDKHGNLYSCKKHHFIRPENALWVVRCIPKVGIERQNKTSREKLDVSKNIVELHFRENPTRKAIHKKLRDRLLDGIDFWTISIVLTSK